MEREGGGGGREKKRGKGRERERVQLCDPKESLCCVLVKTEGNVMQSLCGIFDYQHKQCDSY